MSCVESPASRYQATEIREKEKAENTVTISDAQEAQTAVSQAVTVCVQSNDPPPHALGQQVVVAEGDLTAEVGHAHVPKHVLEASEFRVTLALGDFLPEVVPEYLESEIDLNYQIPSFH